MTNNERVTNTNTIHAGENHETLLIPGTYKGVSHDLVERTANEELQWDQLHDEQLLAADDHSVYVLTSAALHVTDLVGSIDIEFLSEDDPEGEFAELWAVAQDNSAESPRQHRNAGPCGTPKPRAGG